MGGKEGGGVEQQKDDEMREKDESPGWNIVGRRGGAMNG